VAMDTWSVGELAARTGLTVRTLHHYDEIGLARPSRRTAAGHRRYTEADVRRLHRIVALRGFGFPLPEIAALLDDPEPDARELIRRQLDQVADRLARAERLRDRLGRVLEMFDAADTPSAAVLVQLIEEMTAVDHQYTPEEFERMAAHRRAMAEQMSEEQLAEMAARRRAIFDSLTPEQVAELRRSRPSIGSAG
jgi:MerR family transcriptional regulator, thiopeptide resistance regulator